MQLSVIEKEISLTEMQILVFKIYTSPFSIIIDICISIRDIYISDIEILEICLIKLNSRYLYLKYRYL